MSAARYSLKCFRSLWAAPTERALLQSQGGRSGASSLSYAERLVSHFHRQGYDGVEASLADLDALGGLRHVQRLLADRGMGLIVGVYSGWVDYEDENLPQQFEGIQRHLDRFRRQLDAALSTGDRPVWVNAHAGSDHWSRAQQLEFLAHALEIEQQFDCNFLSYETHRGRIFYSPWPTLELLDALPSLKLTLDFSHWAVVAERLLDTPQDNKWLLDRVIPHVHHVHGRVGSAQSAQVSHPHDASVSRSEDARFQRLWEAIWQFQYREFRKEMAVLGSAKDVRAFSTFTPEYGPAPYAPRDQEDPEMDAYDVDELCAERAEHQRRAFHDLLRL